MTITTFLFVYFVISIFIIFILSSHNDLTSQFWDTGSQLWFSKAWFFFLLCCRNELPYTQAHSRLELNVMASYNLGSERKTSKVSLLKPSQHSGLKKIHTYGFPAASSVKSGNLNPHHTYQTYIQTEKQYIKHWMQKNWIKPCA